MHLTVLSDMPTQTSSLLGPLVEIAGSVATPPKCQLQPENVGLPLPSTVMLRVSSQLLTSRIAKSTRSGPQETAAGAEPACSSPSVPGRTVHVDDHAPVLV